MKQANPIVHTLTYLAIVLLHELDGVLSQPLGLVGIGVEGGVPKATEAGSAEGELVGR